MGKFYGLIISDKKPNDKMFDFLNRYSNEKFDSEFEIDFHNPDYQFDYYVIGDMYEKNYIITKNGEKVNSEIISNIDFEKCIFNLVNNLYCIVDKYHWYDYESIKFILGIKNDIEAFKEILSSIKDRNKVLTIATFHC